MARKTNTPSSSNDLVTLTKAQIQAFRDISSDLTSIRRILEDLEREEEITRVMFNVGIAYSKVNGCEDKLDELLEPFEECEYCDDDDN